METMTLRHIYNSPPPPMALRSAPCPFPTGYVPNPVQRVALAAILCGVTEPVEPRLRWCAEMLLLARVAQACPDELPNTHRVVTEILPHIKVSLAIGQDVGEMLGMVENALTVDGVPRLLNALQSPAASLMAVRIVTDTLKELGAEMFQRSIETN